MDNHSLRFTPMQGGNYPDWATVQLGDIGNFTKGKGLPKDQLNSQGSIKAIPYTSIYTNFNECFNYDAILQYTDSDEITIIDQPALLFASSSNMRENIGKSSLYIGTQPVAIGGDTIIFFSEQCSLVYITYLLSTESYRKIIKSISQGSTIIHLYSSQLEKLEIPLPCLEEQEKIADFFTALDEKITLIDEQLSQLNLYKQAQLQIIFSPENTENWGTSSLGEVCEMINTKIDTSDLTITTYISTENMKANFSGVTKSAKLPDYGKATKFQQNDILMSNIRVYLRKIWCATFDGGASSDVIVLRPNKNVSSVFLFNVLCSDNYIAYSMTGTKGTKMPRGDKDVIKQFSLPLPSLEEQAKIADYLSALDDKITNTQQSLEQIKSYKLAMLQKMIT